MRQRRCVMRLKVVVHQKDDGSFWAEVPAVPGCAAEGRTYSEMMESLADVVESCLNSPVENVKTDDHTRVIEVML